VIFKNEYENACCHWRGYTVCASSAQRLFRGKCSFQSENKGTAELFADLLSDF
jgi:hypothetical protein